MSAVNADVLVADFMIAEVQSVEPDDRVIDAIVTLAEVHVHGLPVVTAGTHQLIGVLSASDVLQALSECDSSRARNDLLDATAVGDLMTREVATIDADATVEEAAKQMLYRDVHRLFVTAGDDLVGVISQSDVVRAVGLGKV